MAAETIADAMKELEVVPDVIDVAPNDVLQVTYEDGLSVNLGKELTPTQVKDQPAVNYPEADENTFYTLIMTDPDAPSRENPTFREILHWLVVNIPGNNFTRGEEIAGYRGSGPPQGTGLHRYIFLLYKQSGKTTFDEKKIPKTSREGRISFKVRDFVNKYSLGNPTAGNFYQAQWDEYVATLHAQTAKN